MKKFDGAKFHIGFRVKFIKLVDGDVDEKNNDRLSAESSKITCKSEIRKALRNQKEDILEKIDRYTNLGSGWIISRIESHFINLANTYGYNNSINEFLMSVSDPNNPNRKIIKKMVKNSIILKIEDIFSMNKIILL